VFGIASIQQLRLGVIVCAPLLIGAQHPAGFAHYFTPTAANEDHTPCA